MSTEGFKVTELHREPESYISVQILKYFIILLPISLPPHELIQIGWELWSVVTSHSLEFHLCSVPVRLYVIHMYASRSGEFNRVIDRAVTLDALYLSDTIVCSSTVRPDYCAGLYMILNDRQEGSCIPGVHYFHIPQSRAETGITHTENPDRLIGWSSSVIL